MRRWRSGRWKLKERELMKLSESLFAPKLGMVWDWKGTEFNLRRDGETVWSSLVDYTPSWDYPGGNSIARILRAYLNTPINQLKAKDIEHITKAAHFHEPEMSKNIERMVSFLLAADRRIGKNILSIWLFVEPDRQVRNIIGHRL